VILVWSSAGAWTELDSIWLNMSKTRPVQWTINVDFFLNLPLPRWYIDYCWSNQEQNIELRAQKIKDEGEADGEASA
jgi:hypothetical protein